MNTLNKSYRIIHKKYLNEPVQALVGLNILTRKSDDINNTYEHFK